MSVVIVTDFFSTFLLPSFPKVGESGAVGSRSRGGGGGGGGGGSCRSSPVFSDLGVEGKGEKAEEKRVEFPVLPQART